MDTFKLNTGVVQRIQQRNSKPFEVSSDFTKVPNVLYRLYMQLPNIKADHILMYIILTSFYNKEKGYAYPTQQQLRDLLRCGKNRPGQLAKDLETVGLIKAERRGFGGNYIYYVYAPITDEGEFNHLAKKVKEQVEKEKGVKRRNKTTNIQTDYDAIADIL